MAQYEPRWPKENVEEVLDSLALTKSNHATSRETGVPVSTVRRWSNHFGEEIAERREELLGGQHEARVEGAIEWTEKIGTEMREALEGLLAEVQAKMGGRKVTLRDLAYAFGMVFDKRQLHEGEPTRIEEQRIDTLQDLWELARSGEGSATGEQDRE